jgi:hypothetical protein
MKYLLDERWGQKESDMVQSNVVDADFVRRCVQCMSQDIVNNEERAKKCAINAVDGEQLKGYCAFDLLPSDNGYVLCVREYDEGHFIQTSDVAGFFSYSDLVSFSLGVFEAKYDDGFAFVGTIISRFILSNMIALEAERMNWKAIRMFHGVKEA